MNLTRLFETQDILDKRIVKEKGLEGQNLLPEKILALQVELGELANEWRGFKFWSENREPRTKAYSHHEEKQHGQNGFSSIAKYDKNPLLEEYVDCLHFILSIGIELSHEDIYVFPMKSNDKITYTISRLMFQAHALEDHIKEPPEDTVGTFGSMFSVFVGLGELLGFEMEQIEQAYYSKNKINH
ncbi:hypothetical protein CSV67_03015 [Sporosarcina sp. P2]|uniref:dUTP diphosphatase n=1 Tax=Sporosarcina sp. P2 TaxID=2048251 RepID=UPI000C166668|nr:dUTP diphosphatase [Sporosarcina sp. P2]PID03628.1 hypothetical protein CSV67_03015 [Sporosarcina sp. P2]